MTKIKSVLGNQCLTSIYYSLLYPYLIYGCLLWGNNYDNPLSQLICPQNKAVRIMNDVPLRDHITPHYVHLGLLKFCDIVKITIVYFYMIMSIGTISPFLFTINHRKSCSKRHFKNIILLNIYLCACARVCVLMNNKAILE